jgi:hypothetical protein
MVLIQLLLPSKPSTETAPPDIADALARTRRELAEKFEGVTAYLRAPAKGIWTASDGHTEADDVVMVEVVTDRFNTRWWRAYAATLAKRFQQESIHVRAMRIQLLDGLDRLPALGRRPTSPLLVTDRVTSG